MKLVIWDAQWRECCSEISLVYNIICVFLIPHSLNCEVQGTYNHNSFQFTITCVI